jgi:hypothetical protein
MVSVVYYENLAEDTNTLCGKNGEFWYVNRNHWDLKG